LKGGFPSSGAQSRREHGILFRSFPRKRESSLGRARNKETALAKSSRKPQLTIARYADRFEAEKARQQQRYCDAFGLWRHCARKPCLRNRACRGDRQACLARALDTVPRQLQGRARGDILAATPANIGGPERAARLCMPRDFYDGTADRDVTQELKRLRSTGKIVQGGENAHTLRLRLVDAGRRNARHPDREGDR
jgi:hypothetical protein